LHNPKHPELKSCDQQKPHAKLSKSILDLATGMSEHWLIKDYLLLPNFCGFRAKLAGAEIFKEGWTLSQLGIGFGNPLSVQQKRG
jgi:hypothetical protein